MDHIEQVGKNQELLQNLSHGGIGWEVRTKNKGVEAVDISNV